MRNDHDVKRNLFAGSALYLAGFICFTVFLPGVPQFAGFMRNGAFNPKSLFLLADTGAMFAGILVFLRGAGAVLPGETERGA